MKVRQNIGEERQFLGGTNHCKTEVAPQVLGEDAENMDPT